MIFKDYSNIQETILPAIAYFLVYIGDEMLLWEV
jgi:hypothetical protein